MQNAQKIDGFLRQHPNAYYCDACLSVLTGVKPANQVNQTTRPLSLNPMFRRRDDQMCVKCGNLRKCIGYVGGTATSKQSLPATTRVPTG